MSSLQTLRIPSPVPTSQSAPATIGPMLDPQSKVVLIATVIARIAITAIAAVAAFVFLPLPFAIIATAALVIANVAICFCKCTSQPQNLERSGSFNATTIDTPPPSSSSNIHQETDNKRPLLIRPQPRFVRLQELSAASASHPQAGNRVPEQLARSLESSADPVAAPQPTITIVHEEPSSEMPSTGLDMHTMGDLASAAAQEPQNNPIQELILTELVERAQQAVSEQLLNLSSAAATAPQLPRTIVGGGHASEMPSIGLPNRAGLDMHTFAGGALASAAAPSFHSSLPQSASIEAAPLVRGELNATEMPYQASVERLLSSHPAAAAPQPPRTIVGGGHASEMPSFRFPTRTGLDMHTRGRGALASAAAPETARHRGAFSPPQALASTGLRIDVTPQLSELPPSPPTSAPSIESLRQKGYRTLVGSSGSGPTRRTAKSLTAARVAAAAAVEEEERSGSEEPQADSLPGAIPESSTENDVSI